MSVHPLARAAQRVVAARGSTAADSSHAGHLIVKAT
jgi:hypothetical protein